METTIVKIEGNKIQAIVDNDVKEFELEEWVKPEFVKLGKAELTIKDGKVNFCTMKKIENPIEKPGTKEKSKWEDDMVTFEDLLKAAHKLKAPFSIKTEMLALDLEKKYALFKAIVIVHEGFVEEEKGSDGKSVNTICFEGHGDATAENVTGEFIKPHFIRMAETRAIVRALRWYTNNGCAEEEK